MSSSQSAWTKELTELLGRLLATLEALAAGARGAASARDALDVIQRLLALLGNSKRSGHRRRLDRSSGELRRLTAALEAVRQRLSDALSAEHQLTVAGTQLRDVWAELSPAVASRGRFWDTV